MTNDVYTPSATQVVDVLPSCQSTLAQNSGYIVHRMSMALRTVKAVALAFCEASYISN